MNDTTTLNPKKQMKYELTKNTKKVGFITLYQIQALKDFGKVKKGDLGGWIEKEENLSQQGNCWVSGDARVSDNAFVSGNARVSGNAKVSGDARVSGDADVSGDAEVARLHGENEKLREDLTRADALIRQSDRVFRNEESRAEKAEAKVKKLDQLLSDSLKRRREFRKWAEANLRRAVEIAEKFKRHTWDVEYLDLKVELDEIKATLNPKNK